MSASTEDIAASLTMEDVPIKLRCAACNHLAKNAFRLPCCDQIICEDCQTSLPEACPVCLHEPIKKEDCRPNKALRTTVKVFLRKKIIDRENLRKAKELSDKATANPNPTPLVASTPALRTPPTLVPTATDVIPGDVEAKQSSREQSQVPLFSAAGEGKAADAVVPTEAQKDIPQMSIESPGVEIPRRDSTQTAGDGSVGQDKADDGGKSLDQQQGSGQNQQWANMNGMGQVMNNSSFGLDGTNGIPNMGLNGMGDFSQMMQFMPNGMPNPMMGAFPNMMGMPGMMDPTMMSQGMYGGFGGQGMGMNGMNMGMGFDAGQGAFGGGFNGQPSWNAGQNKFNQNAYGGNAGNDFGANAGSYGAGYNMPPQHQGNFNQVNNHQNYPNNDFHHGQHGQGFQARGRGRGRGYQNYGRGRGGYNQYNQYNQVPQGNHANNESFNPQTPSEVTRRGSPQYGEKLEQPLQQHHDSVITASQQVGDVTASRAAEEQMNKELNPGDADDDMPDPALQPLIREDVAAPTESVVPEVKVPDQVENAETTTEEQEEKPAPIQSFVPDDDVQAIPSVIENTAIVAPVMMPPPGPSIPTGPAARYGGDVPIDTNPRGRGAGRGHFRGNDFRPGLQGRGSGYSSNTSMPRVQPFTSPIKTIVPPIEPKGLGVEGAPKGPKALREGSQNSCVKGFSIAGRASATPQPRPTNIAPIESASRERSRSPSRHQSSSHRHHRHRSTSASTDDEREKRRERHHRHSRKYEDENGEGKGPREPRTRDASADSSVKRSSHRSRRDYEKEKDTERSSHRSHRHRERSREKEEDSHRSNKKRSPSPEISIHGASRMNGIAKPAISSNRKDREDEVLQSSRKRRSDDEDHHREHKRSRRDREEPREERREEAREEKENDYRSERKSSKREDKISRSGRDQPPQKSIPKTEPEKEEPKVPPKGPKIDQHAMEREARDAERVARENQRRAQMGGSGGTGKAGIERVNGKGGVGKVVGKGVGGTTNVKGGSGRRTSYKYEDEVMTSKVETEREASRYR